jgi:hypothetical protein
MCTRKTHDQHNENIKKKDRKRMDYLNTQAPLFHTFWRH